MHIYNNKSVINGPVNQSVWAAVFWESAFPVLLSKMGKPFKMSYCDPNE